MLKLLGALDFAAALFLILAQWDIGLGIASILAIYIIVKSLLFFGNWASFVDLAAGAYMLLAIYDIHSALSIIFALWLLQKSFFSLFF
ncbi:hypothetical protein HYV89_03535 [Candidatus Woesearchaeota archaeon]|nr:hypothetical protein [Candidatus Woesearchaeota archaeon]